MSTQDTDHAALIAARLAKIVRGIYDLGYGANPDEAHLLVEHIDALRAENARMADCHRMTVDQLVRDHNQVTAENARKDEQIAALRGWLEQAACGEHDPAYRPAQVAEHALRIIGAEPGGSVREYPCDNKEPHDAHTTPWMNGLTVRCPGASAPVIEPGPPEAELVATLKAAFVDTSEGMTASEAGAVLRSIGNEAAPTPEYRMSDEDAFRMVGLAIDGTENATTRAVRATVKAAVERAINDYHMFVPAEQVEAAKRAERDAWAAEDPQSGVKHGALYWRKRALYAEGQKRAAVAEAMRGHGEGKCVGIEELQRAASQATCEACYNPAKVCTYHNPAIDSAPVVPPAMYPPLLIERVLHAESPGCLATYSCDCWEREDGLIAIRGSSDPARDGKCPRDGDAAARAMTKCGVCGAWHITENERANLAASIGQPLDAPAREAR